MHILLIKLVNKKFISKSKKSLKINKIKNLIKKIIFIICKKKIFNNKKFKCFRNIFTAHRLTKEERKAICFQSTLPIGDNINERNKIK